MLPPLPATGSVRIELFGPPLQDTGDAWDSGIWDEARWGGVGWQDVTPESMNVQMSWGTDDNMGALSVSAAGSWQIATYDPQRLLDPSNYESPLAAALKPGGLIRVTYAGGGIARTGFIDDISFNMMDKTGSIRASDGISMLAKAKCPEGLANLPETPLTLRAFTRFILAKASVGYITVEPDPPAPDYDPSIGLAIDSRASAWQQITAAALDCLHAVYLDRGGVLRFRYFGKPRDTGIDVGGDAGIPIDDVTTRLSLDGVFNHAIAKYQSFSSEPGDWADRQNDQSVAIFGDLAIKRDHPIPNAWEWVDQILQDRGAASVQYEIGTLRPRTDPELESILGLGVGDRVSLRVHQHGTPVNRDVTVLGGTVEANTESGWSATLATYEPASPWWNKDADRLHLRRYDALESVETSSTWSGSGLTYSCDKTKQVMELLDRPSDITDPAPYLQGRTTAHKFEAIDFTDMREVYDAKLRVFLVDHNDDLTGKTGVAHFPQLRQELVMNWVSSNACPATGGVPGSIGYTEIGDHSMDGVGGRWVEFDFRAQIALWQSGTPQNGVILYGWPFDPNTDPTHLLVGSALHKYKPYILVAFKRV